VLIVSFREPRFAPTLSPTLFLDFHITPVPKAERVAIRFSALKSHEADTQQQPSRKFREGRQSKTFGEIPRRWRACRFSPSSRHARCQADVERQGVIEEAPAARRPRDVRPICWSGFAGDKPHSLDVWTPCDGIHQKRVRLPAGGFGYFLSVSLYFSTTSSIGPAVHPNSAPTTRSSCGSISML
jgi:hypothetical protein